MAMTWDDLAFAVVFNCGIALIAFVIFNILRRLSFLSHFYMAKRFLAIPFRFRPPALPKSFLTWIHPVFTLPDEQFARVAGVDALTYVRYLWLCTKIAFLVTVIAFVALLPTHLTNDLISKTKDRQDRLGCKDEGTGNALEERIQEEDAPMAAPSAAEVLAEKCGFIVTTFDKTSLSNVQPESMKLWVHVAVIYVITFVILVMLWQHYEETIAWRVLHLSWLRRGDEGHTVLVQDVPTTNALEKGADLVSAAIEDIDDLFETKKKDVYLKDTNTVDPRRVGGEATGSYGMPPQPLLRRTDLAAFESRPPLTDFEPAKQVDAALEKKVPMRDIVRREFARSIGAEQVEAVNVVYDDGAIAGVKGDYDKVMEKILDITDSWIGTMRADAKDKNGSRKKIKRKEVKLGKMMGMGKVDEETQKAFGDKDKADEMQYSIFRMRQLKRELAEKREDVLHEPTHASFVSLRTRQAQAVASTGLLSIDATSWLTQCAPNSREIIWNNVTCPHQQRGLRRLMGWGILALVIVFFFPIIFGLQQIVNLEGYAEPGNWAQWLLDAPLLGNLLKTIMPTLALTIILAVMPIVLKMVAAKIEKQPSLSAVDFSLGQKYFIFQFFVVFAFNTILGAASTGTSGGDSALPVIDLFNELRDDPGAITDWLGQAIPQQASYFLTFLLTKGVFASSIRFLRLPGAVIYFILSKISTSERAKKRTWSRQYASYGTAIPSDSMAFLILIVFSVSQPFVSAAALFYFVCSHLFWRYDLLYTKREAFQSGGLFWPVMYNQMLVGIFIFQLSYIGILSIKKFPYSVILFIPTIVTACWAFVVYHKFARPLKFLAVHTAADLDRADLKYDWMKHLTDAEMQQMKAHNWDTEDVELGPIAERFLQPSLQFDPEEYARVISQAREASRLVDIYNNDGQVSGEGLMQTYNSTGPIDLEADNSEKAGKDKSVHAGSADNAV
eukprot:jgi/Ulvmu1/11178/UM072_0014.1